MKKLMISLFVAVMATVTMQAQQIAVVSKTGATSIYQTFQEAIEGASAESVIYLPGGGFPIADSVKITKKLTIIGIGHKGKTDNADGYTTISGNLFFDEGSDASAVMGAYITGGVIIAEDGSQVDNVLVRYCNLDRVEVRNNQCMETVVNQNYIRSRSHFGGARAEFTNNIAHSIAELDNGFVYYNVFSSRWEDWGNAIQGSDNTSMIGNIFHDWGYRGPHSGGNCSASNNMANGDWGDDPINVSGVDWADIFVNSAGVTPNSDYHFKGEYEKYNGKCGIYAGTGFSDSALPPVPYIVAKQIPEQTDANGKLNIKIRVRAGE